MNLAGIVFLHEIAQTRLPWTAAHRDFATLLCGDDALGNVVLATTKWARGPEDIHADRERELADGYWKEMIEHGSTMARFYPEQASALRIIDSLLQKSPIAILSLRTHTRRLPPPRPKPNKGMFGFFKTLFR